MSQIRRHHVWDATTRWFHWINVFCVAGLAAIGIVIMNAGGLDISNAGKVTLKTAHVWIGYVFSLNLLWRLIWAFIGGPHARWRAILPGGRGYGRALSEYLGAFFSGRPVTYLGHNPAGRLAVSLLLLLLVVQALTGLFLAGTDLFYPPIGPWIAQWVAAPGTNPADLLPYAPQMYAPEAYEAMRAWRAPIIELHEINFFILGAMIVLHIAAVVITEIRERSGLISAMFSGEKIIEGTAADEVD